jgi:hypothetical protein
MKSPGEAALEFTLVPDSDGGSEFTLLARFQPRGLTGLIYWYGMFLPHLVLFIGLVKGLAKAAGTPVLKGPYRFTPAVPVKCELPSRKV